MAENENGEEKTEEATHKKLTDARKKGQVAKSNDVVSVLFILGVFALIRVCAGLIYSGLSDNLEYWLSLCGYGLEKNSVIDGDNVRNIMWTRTVRTVLIVSGPAMLASILLNIIGTGVQTKFLISWEGLKPNFSKFNPISGIKKMFSGKAIFELVKSLLKFIIIALVLYVQLKSKMVEFLRTFDLEPSISFVYMAETVFNIVMTVGGVYIVIAAIDFFYQQFTFKKDMRMTKQEVKDEYKNTEGDPKIKGKRKQKQYELHNLMMQNVKDADVVIRNPTHYAIALRYDPDKNEAPVVTAKGADRVAMRIIREAEEHGVVLVENRPLARALYEQAPLDAEIPYRFYRELADVLTFVYNLKNQAPPKKKEKY